MVAAFYGAFAIGSLLLTLLAIACFDRMSQAESLRDVALPGSLMFAGGFLVILLLGMLVYRLSAGGWGDASLALACWTPVAVVGAAVGAGAVYGAVREKRVQAHWLQLELDG